MCNHTYTYSVIDPEHPLFYVRDMPCQILIRLICACICIQFCCSLTLSSIFELVHVTPLSTCIRNSLFSVLLI